jgi:bifunctional non-homologous end joining protein LigD
MARASKHPGPDQRATKRAASQVLLAMPYSPMLASPLPVGGLKGDGWNFEMKWDGIRTICQVRAGTAYFWSRNGNNLTDTFPELVHELPLALSGREAILDGEIVAMDSRGRPSFQRLQDRLGVALSEVASRATRTPVHLMLFDVLDVAGTEAVKKPYRERRELLESIVAETTSVHVPPSYVTDLDSALGISQENSLEGVVAKRPESPYQAGARSRSWCKVKHERSQEVVLVAWVEDVHGDLGSLVLAVPDAHRQLRYAGRVGTGLSQVRRVALREVLGPLARPTPALSDIPRRAGEEVHWVKPALVGEVRFSEWTWDGRLRHATWRGLRSDKSPANIEPPEMP